MKHLHQLMRFLLICIFPAGVICAIAAPYKQPLMHIYETDEQVLSRLNAQFIKNFIAQDTLAHNQLIHKNFVCIESSGDIVQRERYMKEWAHAYQDSHYTSFSYTDESIRIFGNMALVQSKTVYTKKVNDTLVSGHSVYTDTYIKENGRWWCVQAQITPVKA